MDFREFSLETFIGFGTKKDLEDACDYLQVEHKKSWNKTRLAEAIAKSHREEAVKIFFSLPHEGMEFLSRLIRQKCEMVVDTSRKSYVPKKPQDFMLSLEILEFFGLIYIEEHPGGHPEAIRVTAPYELKRIMAPFLTRERKEAAKFLDLVADVARGALYHYGVMSVSRLIDLLKDRLPDLPEDVCYLVLTYRATLMDDIRFDEIGGVEYIFRILSDAQDEELEQAEHEELLRRVSVRPDIDYKPFTLEELVLASMEGFVEDIEGYQQVADALRDHYLPTDATLEYLEGNGPDEGLVGEEFGMFLKAMVEEVKKTGDASYVLKMVSRCMEFRTKEDMEKALPLLMNFLNSIGRYELKGYSPLEVRTSFPGSAGKVVPFRRERAIGRNDLCPCGSGKLYRNCHGSGQNPLN